jgi:hypothetical protein
MTRGGVLGRWRSRMVVGALAIAISGTFVVGCDGDEEPDPQADMSECEQVLRNVSGLVMTQALYDNGVITTAEIRHWAKRRGVPEESYEAIFGDKYNDSILEMREAWESLNSSHRVADLLGALLEYSTNTDWAEHDLLYEERCADLVGEDD